MLPYDELLQKGIESMPKEIQAAERFEIPKVKGHIQGNKTVITNLNQIITAIRRNQEHFIKWMLKELAAPGRWDGPRFVFTRKLNAAMINSKISQYADLFVFCYNCKKPDTTITEDNKLKCTACGTTHQLKG